MRFRKPQASVTHRKNKAISDFLLSDEDFRYAAECERMRVDRNHSTLSLLLIKLQDKHDTDEDVVAMVRILKERLRATDTPGRLKDGRIVVLLPDTEPEGAWAFAVAISEVYPPGPDRPECDVRVYPDREEEHVLDEDELEVAGASSNGESKPRKSPSSSGEPFLAQSVPRWKRSLDIAGSLFGLTVSAPIILAAGLAIKASSKGPVFFCQEREGIGGKRFRMWKLRTMCVDAEARKEDLLQFSEQDGPAFKLSKDPRTTTVGRILRFTSIDELPQFFNVLIGDMSLVGPRPLPTKESTACENWQRRRLTVMPGMTCTWQVSERGNVEFDEWVRMDIRYAEKRSLLQDVKLLVWTLPSLLLNKGMR